VAATVLVDVLLLSSLCLAWAHSDRHQASEERRAIQSSLKGALRNPLLWSMGLGMAAAELRLSLPLPVDDVLRLLAQSATPVALFTLGAMLARSQLARAMAAHRGADDDSEGGESAARSAPDARTTRAHGAVSAVWLPTLLKLGLHPALVWGGGQWLGAVTGVAVPPAGLLVMTMAAALPSASNVSMLAEREGADTGLVARIIMWTTAASLLTLTAWASVLGARSAG